jgi:hypothetical protein
MGASALYMQDTNPPPYSTHLTYFDLEDWGSIYLRNVDSTANICTVQRPKSINNIITLLLLLLLLLLFSSTPFVIMNECWIIYILRRFIPSDKILALNFLLTFSRTKLTVVLLWILLVSVYPLSKLETCPPLRSVMSQRGASRLQTTSANLWTFPIKVTSRLRIHFPLLNPTELHHYRVTSIVLLSRIQF